MKHFFAAVLAACALSLAAPLMHNAVAADAATTTTSAAQATPAPQNAMDEAVSKKAGKSKDGKKQCNPKKSKPCGKACIPLNRTCKKQ